MIPTLTFFSDPGHGWLQVPVECLKSVGLKTSDFSSYSYRHTSAVYLEEDCDAPRFLTACKACNVVPVIRENHTNYDSPIRNYPSIY